MTDLERAQAVLSKVSIARSPVKAMVAILAAARQDGAKEMQKRAEEAIVNLRPVENMQEAAIAAIRALRSRHD